MLIFCCLTFWSVDVVADVSDTAPTVVFADTSAGDTADTSASDTSDNSCQQICRHMTHKIYNTDELPHFMRVGIHLCNFHRVLLNILMRSYHSQFSSFAADRHCLGRHLVKASVCCQ